MENIREIDGEFSAAIKSKYSYHREVHHRDLLRNENCGLLQPKPYAHPLIPQIKNNKYSRFFMKKNLSGEQKSQKIHKHQRIIRTFENLIFLKGRCLSPEIGREFYIKLCVSRFKFSTKMSILLCACGRCFHSYYLFDRNTVSHFAVCALGFLG